MSLGTPWGLFRHYWVVLKLLITVFSTAVLLIYMQTFREMAGVAADPRVALAQVRNPSPVVHAILALFLLMSATVLAIYRPLSLTAYGRQKRADSGSAMPGPGVSSAGSSGGPAVGISLWRSGRSHHPALRPHAPRRRGLSPSLVAGRAMPSRRQLDAPCSSWRA